MCRTRRVVSFGLIGRFLYVRWESGRTRLRVCLDDGAPAGHDLAVSQASPCKVSGARYRGSEEGTAFQRSYLSVQHAALVPRCVGRHQCPHPCFLPAATRSDSGSFCGSSMRARRSGRAALRVSAGNVIRVIEEWLSRAPPPQRLAQLQRETTPARAGRGLRAEIHA